MKKTLTATFDSGHVITRKTERSYTHVWVVFSVFKDVTGELLSKSGFSPSADKARSTAQSYINWLDKHCGKHPRRLEVVEVRVT